MDNAQGRDMIGSDATGPMDPHGRLETLADLFEDDLARPLGSHVSVGAVDWRVERGQGRLGLRFRTAEARDTTGRDVLERNVAAHGQSGEFNS